MTARFVLEGFTSRGVGESVLLGGRLVDGARREDAAEGGGRSEEAAEGGGRSDDAADRGGRRELPLLGRGEYCWTV